MRDSICFCLNGRPITAGPAHTRMSLADFIRRELNQTGTKVACGQGGCGACTVLVARPFSHPSTISNSELGPHDSGDLTYEALNACLLTPLQVHGCHVVTIEGITPEKEHAYSGHDTGLSAIQQAFWGHHAAQCGFCTPGMIVTATGVVESRCILGEQAPCEPAEWQNALCGNICRCTGYKPILEALGNVEWSLHRRVNDIFVPEPLRRQLTALLAQSVALSAVGPGTGPVFLPTSLQECAQLLSRYPQARVLAGGTEGKGHPLQPLLAQDSGPSDVTKERAVISIGQISQFHKIETTATSMTVGAAVTIERLRKASKDAFPPLARFLELWGAPQLRNAGTLAGSVVNASPVSDSLPFLLACGAEVEIMDARGSSWSPLGALLPERGPIPMAGKILTRIRFSLPAATSGKMAFFKVRHRQAFDRAIVNLACRYTHGEGGFTLVTGGMGHRVQRLPNCESALQSAHATRADWEEAASIAVAETSPFHDNSGGPEYKRLLLRNLILQWGQEVMAWER